VIDIHTHLHPPRLFAAIRRWFADRTSWDLRGQPTEPAEVAAALREAGVERFVFCSYAHRPGMARELNAWLAQTSRDLGRFGIPLASVHPEDSDYVDYLRAALNDGCVGLKLHEDVQRLACDDERFDPVYRELEARNGFLLVHVGPIPWAFPKREGLARVDRVLERYPAMNVVVAHFGVPDTSGYFDLMQRRHNLHLDTTMVLAQGSPMEANKNHVTIDVAAIERHADRVLYGTDFPNIRLAYDGERRGIESLGLSPATLRAVLHDNANRLLRDSSIYLAQRTPSS